MGLQVNNERMGKFLRGYDTGFLEVSMMHVAAIAGEKQSSQALYGAVHLQADLCSNHTVRQPFNCRFPHM